MVEDRMARFSPRRVLAEEVITAEELERLMIKLKDYEKKEKENEPQL